MTTIGRRGDEKGEFHFPLTVALSRSGDTLYIVDSFHFAVQAFDLDGNYLFSFGPTKVGIGTMARPRDIAVDSDGHVYVTDAVRNNVQIYDSLGNLLLRFGTAGTGAGQFRLPAGICIDSEDTIYISDSVNGRIQVFKYVGYHGRSCLSGRSHRDQAQFYFSDIQPQCILLRHPPGMCFLPYHSQRRPVNRSALEPRD